MVGEQVVGAIVLAEQVPPGPQSEVGPRPQATAWSRSPRTASSTTAGPSAVRVARHASDGVSRRQRS